MGQVKRRQSRLRGPREFLQAVPDASWRSAGDGGFPLLTEGKVHNRCADGWSGRVDTLGVSVPVEPGFEVRGGAVSISKYGQPDETVTVRHALPRGGFVALGKGERAWIELSAKAAGEGSNVYALTVPEALESIREAITEAADFCTVVPGHRFEDSRLVRVDGVRDFEAVDHIPELLSGLARVPSPDARYKRQIITSGEHNGAQTLRVGPRAHGSLLYSKFEECRRPEAKGRLRFETRQHREQLTSKFAAENGGHMRVVGDMTSEKVATLTRASFKRAGFDRPVLPAQAVAATVFAVDGLSAAEQMAWWAYLTLPDAQSRMHRNTQRKYRQLSQTYAVGPVDVINDRGDYCVMLDFDSGREVRYAA